MIANLVNAEEVTKAETKIIRQIFAYIKVESANMHLEIPLAAGDEVVMHPAN
ncbi:unnamed protein product, partial [Brassica oleracea]